MSGDEHQVMFIEVECPPDSPDHFAVFVDGRLLDRGAGLGEGARLRAIADRLAIALGLSRPESAAFVGRADESGRFPWIESAARLRDAHGLMSPRGGVAQTEFDPDTFHDYVVAHGFGEPTEVAIAEARAEWNAGEDSYADLASAAVAGGYTADLEQEAPRP